MEHVEQANGRGVQKLRRSKSFFNFRSLQSFCFGDVNAMALGAGTNELKVWSVTVEDVHGLFARCAAENGTFLDPTEGRVNILDNSRDAKGQRWRSTSVSVSSPLLI